MPVTRLVTIPMSHYCEKARWGLTRAGIAYDELRHLQGFHYLWSFTIGRTPMVPVLDDGGHIVTDSTDILRYIDTKLPVEERLYPEQAFDEISRLETRFDEVLGVETRRWVYHHFLSRPRESIQIAGYGVPKLEQKLGRPLFPLLRGFLKKRLDVTAENVRRGMEQVDGIFEEVETRLADGRRYLCGDRFTAADLTFACMAAPVVLPPNYGIPLPQLETSPPSMRETVEKAQKRAAGQFALRLFSEEKP